MKAALRIDNLSKSFGKPAVDQLSLTIDAGEFYALLGPNGAGKTTCLRMVAGLLQPDSGRIEIFGHDIAKDPRAAKQIVAWLPDEPMLYEKLTAWEYLDFIAGLWRLDRKKAKAQAEELLVRVALIDQRQSAKYHPQKNADQAKRQKGPDFSRIVGRHARAEGNDAQAKADRPQKN